MRELSYIDKKYLDLNALRVLEEELKNWHNSGLNKFYYQIPHKKFDLEITLLGESCNYYAYITTKNGKRLNIDKASPKASTPWEEVKKYYLIHAKDTYFRYRDKVREEKNDLPRIQ